ncbi:MAG: alginate export family protein [Alphaproteobacteria bacterium]|nr:alginate export family protein [Alphaproteobacteria bacterium]
MRRIILSILISTSIYTTAQADYFKTLVNNDKGSNTKIELGTVVTVALAKVNNATYGAGSADNKNQNIRRDNPFWQEYAIYPKIRTTTSFTNLSELYSGWSVVAAGTQGNGDASPISTTSHKPFFFDTEEAYMGWRSGKMFKGYDNNLIDISVGNQSFQVGDGFVIADGTSDAFRRGASFTGPRTAFRETAIVRINTYPVKGQIFHLRTNTNQRYMRGTDQPRALMYGGNIEYVSRDPKDISKIFWTVGAMFLNIYKADRKSNASSQSINRDGLQVYNPRFGGNFCPWNRDIRFFAGYVHQKNNKTDRKTNTHAYYIEPGYTFSKIWGKPLLTYRYMFFSGDANPGSAVKKSYDPLMFGFWRRDGVGTWEIGEIYGQFYATNTNQKVHSVQLRFNPTEQFGFGLLYYNINYDKPQQAGSLSRRTGDEWDLYSTWSPYEWLSFSAIAGAVIPKAGLKQSTIASTPTVDPGRIGKTTYFGYLSAAFKF